MLKHDGVDKVYVSSVNTDPLLYQYIGELIAYLRANFAYVGIRTNAAMLNEDNYSVLDNCTEEISISVNSCVKSESFAISGKNSFHEWRNLIQYLKTHPGEKHDVRVSIVVNRHNEGSILQAIQTLAEKFPSDIRYIQLRKVYKYGDRRHCREDWAAFEKIASKMERKFKRIGSYHESPIYEAFGIKVSLWRDVFSPESVESINYFSDGKITTNHLLVPGYEHWTSDAAHAPALNRVELVYGGRQNFIQGVTDIYKKINTE